ncbi:hypothetical protein C0J52_26410 [Blattella germanica]|nr:hypothetical protein C0J52_26410 [Blattella germanica]
MCLVVLQAEFERVTSATFKLGLKTLVLIVSVISTAAAVFSVYISADLHKRKSVLELNSLAVTTIITGLMIGQWFWINKCLQKVVQQVQAEFTKVVDTTTAADPSKIIQYKFLWLKMSKLAQNLGGAMGYTYMSLLVQCFICLIPNVYSYMSYIGGQSMGDYRLLGMSTCFFIFAIYVICSSADNTTHKIGSSFQDSLNIVSSKLSESHETIIRQMISQLSTYIIVVLQFNLGASTPSPQSTLMPTESISRYTWLDLIALGMVPTLTILMLSQWEWINICLRKGIEQVETEFNKVMEFPDIATPKQIAQYEFLWLKLSELAQNFGESMGYSYIGLLAQSFVSLIPMAYMYFYFFIHNSAAVSGILGSSIIFYMVTIYILCSAAGKTSSKMRYFLDTIADNPPTINLCSYIPINKSLLCTMTSQLATYMVVIIQFHLGESSSPPSSSKSTSSEPSIIV